MVAFRKEMVHFSICCVFDLENQFLVLPLLFGKNELDLACCVLSSFVLPRFGVLVGLYFIFYLADKYPFKKLDLALCLCVPMKYSGNESFSCLNDWMECCF